jgi:hypothetical protein
MSITLLDILFVYQLAARSYRQGGQQGYEQIPGHVVPSAIADTKDQGRE